MTSDRASDFWIYDRRQDIALGGMSLAAQREVLDELQASRERERELEAALGDPQGAWTEKMMLMVASQAAYLLPPVKPQGTTIRSVWVANLVRAIKRAVYDAYREVGLIGDHPGLRFQAEQLLMRERADVRAALEPQSSSARSTSLESQPAK